MLSKLEHKYVSDDAVGPGGLALDAFRFGCIPHGLGRTNEVSTPHMDSERKVALGKFPFEITQGPVPGAWRPRNKYVSDDNR